MTCVHHQIIPRTIAPPMILITKSSSSSVVWRICGVLLGAALTPPVESMSEMGSNEFTTCARAAMYVCVHSHPQGPSVFLKWSLRANRGGGSSDENRDFKIKRRDDSENVAYM